jgi:pimeloyl-ACP methyl ester carboxylesterase
MGYLNDIRAARKRISSGSKIISTHCGLIEYADIGSGPVVFVIHGAGGGFDQSMEMAADFGASDYRIIAPSRFGYLRTPMPDDASPVAQADAHAALLQALNINKTIVVGGSMGAPSAMQLYLRHPDLCTALVLLFPLAYAPQFDQPSQRMPQLVRFAMEMTLKSDFAFWTASKVAPEMMMRTILGTPPEDFRNASSEEKERVLRTLDHILPVSARQMGLMSDGTVASTIPRYDLEHVAVPTLIIAAEDDLYGTFERGRYTAEHILGARFVSYRTGGHLLVGHREEVQAELNAFLLSVLKKPVAA